MARTAAKPRGPRTTIQLSLTARDRVAVLAARIAEDKDRAVTYEEAIMDAVEARLSEGER
jgi:hypothetical protein